MTHEGDGGRDGLFARGVFDATQEINKKLIELEKRYPTMVVIAALGEHVGCGMHLLLKRGVCTQEQARAVLAHIEETAFYAELLM